MSSTSRMRMCSLSACTPTSSVGDGLLLERISELHVLVAVLLRLRHPVCGPNLFDGAAAGQ